VVIAGPGAGADDPACSATPPEGAATFVELGRYDAHPPPGSVQTAAEIVAYENDTLWVLNIGTVDIVDVSDPATPERVAQLTVPG
jgi:hypothetical protein